MNRAKKILVIDDDFDIREVIRFILQEEGYQVSELGDGHHVDAEIARSAPDLILLDVMLGDMDGRDICARLKAKSGTVSIPVIMVSATHCRPEAGENGCSADDYLAKPFDLMDLVDKVKLHSAA